MTTAEIWLTLPTHKGYWWLKDGEWLETYRQPDAKFWEWYKCDVPARLRLIEVTLIGTDTASGYTCGIEHRTEYRGKWQEVKSPDD